MLLAFKRPGFAPQDYLRSHLTFRTNSDTASLSSCSVNRKFTPNARRESYFRIIWLRRPQDAGYGAKLQGQIRRGSFEKSPAPLRWRQKLVTHEFVISDPGHPTTTHDSGERGPQISRGWQKSWDMIQFWIVAKSAVWCCLWVMRRPLLEW